MSDMSLSSILLVKPLSYAELNVFCEQVALMLKAGISVYEGMCILQEEAATPAEEALYRMIIAEMDDGKTFSSALGVSGAFPDYMVQMVEIGEVAGRLDTVLEQLGRYYKREQSMRDAVHYAVSYPVMMMVMMSIVIAVLAVKVLPIFNDVFTDLGTELTGFSRRVMDMGLALSASLSVLVIVLVVALIAVWFLAKNDAGKVLLGRLQRWFPLTKPLAYKIAVSRFAAGMSLMLASGLDTQQSFEQVSALVDHPEVEEQIKRINEAIADGQSFAQAMGTQRIFSQTYHRMLGIGERTGNIDEVMENISQRYEAEIETTLSNLIGIIEPSLVAVLSVVVGAILLAVMLPLMSIMSVL